MKKTKKLSQLTLSILTIVLLSITISCDKMNPGEVDSSAQVMQETSQGIKILELGITGSSLKKVSTVTEKISAEKGGTLELSHENEDLGNAYDHLSIETKLEILPYAMSDDAAVSLTIDDEYFMGAMDVVFAPHGTIFKTPALLSIYAEGLNLGDYDADDLNFYYYNEEDGIWELMQYESFVVSIRKGKFELKNAELPHFSRYAIGTE